MGQLFGGGPAMACFNAAREMMQPPSFCATPQKSMARFKKLNDQCRMPEAAVHHTLETDSCENEDDTMEFSESSIDGSTQSLPVLSPKDHVLRLASLQSAQGSFAASDLIAEAFAAGGAKPRTLAELEAAKPGAVESLAWFTALVVVLLEEKFSELQDYWELFVDKAREWLARQHSANMAAVEELLTAAKQQVNA
jgi:hypothetical protein